MTISKKCKLALIKFGPIFFLWITLTINEKMNDHPATVEVPVNAAPEKQIEDLEPRGDAAVIDAIPPLKLEF